MQAVSKLLALVVLLLPAAVSAAPPEPVRLIFDTDMGADIDDALALGMIHALQDRGVCRLLAVTLTNAHADAGPVVDVLNTFYGRGDTPLGAPRNGNTATSPYLAVARQRDGDQPRYPHRVQATKELPDAVGLLRRTLAAQPDGSVVIAQVGLSTNLAALLRSMPDKDAELSGVELVKRKVKLLSIMAGAFTPIGGKPGYVEYNVKQDLPAAIRLAADWPTPIVWSGFEIGLAVQYPARSIERDFAYVKHHPVAEGYRLYMKFPYDRPTWDLTAVLHAVYPDRGYFDLSPAGRVTVEKNGATRFDPDDRGRDRYLILRPEQKARTLEALIQLASQPPLRRPQR